MKNITTLSIKAKGSQVSSEGDMYLETLDLFVRGIFKAVGYKEFYQAIRKPIKVEGEKEFNLTAEIVDEEVTITFEPTLKKEDYLLFTQCYHDLLNEQLEDMELMNES